MRRKIIYFLFTILFAFSVNGLAQDSDDSGRRLSSDEIERLVAPIALYPDPLLAQVLPASTYPLEIVQAARIIHKKKDFPKIDGQNWDPSVKAVAHYPDVLKMMNEKLEWTQDLGQAVLTQQDEVMRTIQALRQKADRLGNLESTKQQVIERTDETVEIIPARPDVIYVPSYNTEIVYSTPRVEVSFPLISFSSAWVIGDWFYTGFYWPDRHLVYGDPFYWRDRDRYRDRNWDHRNRGERWNRSDRDRPDHFYRTPERREGPSSNQPWRHDREHGNPFNGRHSSGENRPNSYPNNRPPSSYFPDGGAPRYRESRGHEYQKPVRSFEHEVNQSGQRNFHQSPFQNNPREQPNVRAREQYRPSSPLPNPSPAPNRQNKEPAFHNMMQDGKHSFSEIRDRGMNGRTGGSSNSHSTPSENRNWRNR